MKRTLLISALLLSVSARADFQTAGSIYPGLVALDHHHKNEAWSKQEIADFEFANGYIQAVADTMNSKAFCIIPNTKGGQLMLAVKLFIDRYPSFKGFDAKLIVEKALAEIYPCKADK